MRLIKLVPGLDRNYEPETHFGFVQRPEQARPRLGPNAVEGRSRATGHLRMSPFLPLGGIYRG